MHPAHNLIRTPARAIVSALGFNRHLRAADVEAVAANADSQAGNACAAFESRRGLWRVKADRVDALACQGFGAEIFHAAAFARGLRTLAATFASKMRARRMPASADAAPYPVPHLDTVHCVMPASWAI